MSEGEKAERIYRAGVARLTAHSFILDYLLKHVFLTMPRQARLDMAKALLDSSGQTEWLRGAAQDDFHAEQLADIVVLMQTEIDQMIGRALSAVAETEERMWQQD